MVIVVMGVSGAGKSTIGALLAHRIHCVFYDADNYHPITNIEKMRAGIPLNDADRASWLAHLATMMLEWDKNNSSVVLACSALKQSYRAQLDPLNRVCWVLLNVSFDVARERLDARIGHFMSPELLRSQFETLEMPSHAMVFNAHNPPEILVEEIVSRLR